MHRWIGLVCHPMQFKGNMDRQLQPPPPCDDLPSLLKNWIVKPYVLWSLLTETPSYGSSTSLASATTKWPSLSGSKESSLAYYLAGVSSNALLPLRASTAPGGSISFIGTERNTKSRGSRSMPIGLREYAGNQMCITHLLRGRSNQRRSLPRGVDEYRCRLLQEEERGSRHLLKHL